MNRFMAQIIKERSSTLLAARDGFTFVEVMVSTAVLLLTVVSSSIFFTHIFKEIDASRERISMSAIALSRIEEWRSYPYKNLLPGMGFTYFGRTIDNQTGLIVFNTQTITLGSLNQVNLTIPSKYVAAGYGYTPPPLPSAANMLGGEDAVNQVWYDGPDSTPGNNNPGAIQLLLTCPKGVAGILTITVWDYNNKQREEKISVNDIVIERLAAGSFVTAQQIEYNITQQHTANGLIDIEIRQTADTNSPTFGGLNPNAVVSQIEFDILEGFTEHEAYEPYVVESKISSTYNDPSLVPGWQISVTVSKYPFKPVFLATTIAP